MTQTPEECKAKGEVWNEDLKKCQNPEPQNRLPELQSSLDEQPENNVEARDEEVKKEEK